MDSVASQLSTNPPSVTRPPSQPSPTPAAPFGISREPFIPTPASYSGDLGTCGHFLHQCPLVFDQQPLTYLTDKSRIAFVMSLLYDASDLGVGAVLSQRSPKDQKLSSCTSGATTPSSHPSLPLVPHCSGFCHHRRSLLQGCSFYSPAQTPICIGDSGPSCSPRVPAPWHPRGCGFRPRPPVCLSVMESLLPGFGGLGQFILWLPPTDEWTDRAG